MHFAVLSLMGIGGAITTAPEMHRFLVTEKHWLTDPSFSSSIALAQSAPGPNVLFVALMGWQVGINAGGGLSAGAPAWWLGLLGDRTHHVGHYVALLYPDLQGHQMGPSSTEI
jgi:chromate transporter